jgi:hypothetical protein
MGLRLKVRRCHNEQCSRHLQPYRPEAEGRYVLPQHEFGLDVIALDVPIEGVVSDGQDSIRNAVAAALPGVAHQLCHFHYLREAARPIYEADRHAKKELKKRVRGVRPIERNVEHRDGNEAEVIRGYCAAVRSSITDDGRPPLEASGLKLHGRLTAIFRSIARLAEKRGCRKNWGN